MTFLSHHEIFIRRSWYSACAYLILIPATWQYPADRRIMSRKNWVPASSDEDLVMRSKRHNKVLKFCLWYMNFLLCRFYDVTLNSDNYITVNHIWAVDSGPPLQRNYNKKYIPDPICKPKSNLRRAFIKKWMPNSIPNPNPNLRSASLQKKFSFRKIYLKCRAWTVVQSY